jgi:membrane-associated phospholipid phosphatase
VTIDPRPLTIAPRHVARWISIAFHPFVMVGVIVGTAAGARQGAGGAVRAIALTALFTIVPMAVLMWRQVRRGVWQNVDASNRTERPILYIVGGVTLAALLAYLMVMSSQSFMVRGVVVTLGMIVVCALATRWIKVSLHMAFATLAATTLALMRAPAGYVLLLILPALMWSRLTLDRHAPAEVALGTLIGACAGATIHFL